MGIYVFDREALEQAVANPQLVDFGRHVIPDAVPRQRVQAHVYRGYWEDVGTIQSYFQANLALCDPIPPFDFYDAARPVYTHPRFLPASKLEGCTIHSALDLRGLHHARRRDRAGDHRHPQPDRRQVRIRNSLLLGADFYETLEEMHATEARGIPPVGIGAGSRHRERDHRQERPHRARRPHHQRGRASRRRTATATSSAKASCSSPRTASSPTAPSSRAGWRTSS